MIDNLKVSNFLKDLTALSQKYKIKISTGDCGPLLLEIGEKEKYKYECDIIPSNNPQNIIYFLDGISG